MNLGLSLHVEQSESHRFRTEDYFTHLLLAQRSVTTPWEDFRRDTDRVGRFLRALPAYISEGRLDEAVRRLQARMRVVRLFEDHPRECYRAFTTIQT